MKDISRVILFQIDQTSKIAKQYSQREFDRLGIAITVEQWILMKIIDESQVLSQKDLAQLSLRDPASITRTLDLLEQKGLVRRSGFEGSRKQLEINLTEAGKDFISKHLPIIEMHRAQSLKGFTSEEIDLLGKMLKRIQENME